MNEDIEETDINSTPTDWKAHREASMLLVVATPG
jgi:hypothetical protein